MKHFYNKLVACVLIITVLVAVSVVSPAALMQMYSIYELNMNFEIPDTFVASDINKQIGSDSEKVLFHAVTDKADEFKVTSFSNETTKELFNYKYFTEKEIDDLVLLAQADSDVQSATFFETDSCIFVVKYYLGSGDNITRASAETVVNGDSVTINLDVQNGEMSVENKGIFNDIINSVEFTKLINKPLQVNVSEILILTLWVMLVVLAIIIILLIVYYNKNGNPSMSLFDIASAPVGDREIASKYYDELRDDGFWSETMQIDRLDKDGNVVSSAKKNKNEDDDSIEFVTYHKGVKTVVATVDKWKQMSLSMDEWDENSVEETKNSEEPAEEFFFSFNDGEGPLLKGHKEQLKGTQIRLNDGGEEISRSNNDDFDEFEEVIAVVNNRTEESGNAGGKSTEKTEQKKKEQKVEELKTKIKPSVKIQEKLVEDPVEEEGYVWEESNSGFNEKIVEEIREEIEPIKKERAMPKRDVSDVFKEDDVLKEFETDSYWDKYR